jgi:hypothetical protein
MTAPASYSTGEPFARRLHEPKRVGMMVGDATHGVLGELELPLGHASRWRNLWTQPSALLPQACRRWVKPRGPRPNIAGLRCRVLHAPRAWPRLPESRPARSGDPQVPALRPARAGPRPVGPASQAQYRGCCWWPPPSGRPSMRQQSTGRPRAGGQGRRAGRRPRRDCSSRAHATPGH